MGGTNNGCMKSTSEATTVGYAGMLVGVDHHAYSFEAVVPAAAIASAAGLSLRLFHVVGDGEETGDYERQAEQVGFPIDLMVAGPSPADRAQALDDHAATWEFVPVVTTHSRRALTASIVGSTANELIARSSRPVMLFGPNHSAEADAPSRVLCAVDGSDFSEVMLGRAAVWASVMKVPLWLVQAVEPGSGADVPNESGYLHNLAASLKSDHGGVEWDVLHGRHAGRAIAEYANEQAGTLTVVATHARQGFDRLVHGSVCADIVRLCSGAVLVYNPDQG